MTSIKSVVDSNESKLSNVCSGLNSIKTITKNNNQLLSTVDNNIGNIFSKLNVIDTKLDDILSKSSEVKSISELDRNALADAYKNYYETNSNTSLENKMNFIIQYLMDRNFVKSN